MKLRLVAFGIAKDILEDKEKVVDYNVSSLKELKEKLYADYPKFEQLKSMAFAVHEEYQEEDFLLSDNDEVVLIPPVAGG